MEEKLFKKCSKCGIEKELSLENFGRYKNSKDGFKAICKECRNNDSKAYREDNKEKITEYSREYKKKNKDKIIVSNKKYRKENKEKIAEYNKNYYQENKDNYDEYHKKYRKENKDKISKTQKRHYEKNKEQIRKYRVDNIERRRQYIEKNRDKFKIYNHRRTARKKELANTLTFEEYQSNLKYFNNCCAYCEVELKDTLHNSDSHNIEHIMPISRNEYDWVEGIGTTKRNCIPSCFNCNMSKGNKTISEWYLQQPFYSFDKLLKIYDITSEGKEWIIEVTE